MNMDESTKPFALALDIESTGVDPHEDRIVTIYLGVISWGGDVLIGQEMLVNPGIEIPEGSQAVHGISTEHAREHGREPAAVLGDVASILLDTAQLPIVGQNISYDLTMLLAEVRRHMPTEAASAIEDILRSRNVLDSLVVDKAKDKYRKGSRRLVDMAAHYGVELREEEAHGAAADAIAAARIMLAILRKFPDIAPPRLNWATLHELQQRWRAEQATSFQEWLRKKAPEDRRDPAAVIDGTWPIQVAPRKAS